MNPVRTQAFDFSVNVCKALLWQHNKAPVLQSLLTQKNAWYQANQTQFWEDWVTNVFDLRTCNPFGLEVWSIILNQPVQAPLKSTQKTWGFGSYNQNFGHGNFSNVVAPATFLTTSQQRLLLQLRYAKLTSDNTVPSINAMLKRLLGPNGTGYVLDDNRMHLVYIFNLPADSDMEVVLANYDILPRPSGVGVKYYPRNQCFGFGAFNQNFNNGTFLT